jgi:hypothetical protein
MAKYVVNIFALHLGEPIINEWPVFMGELPAAAEPSAAVASPAAAVVPQALALPASAAAAAPTGSAVTTPVESKKRKAEDTKDKIIAKQAEIIALYGGFVTDLHKLREMSNDPDQKFKPEFLINTYTKGVQLQQELERLKKAEGPAAKKPKTA